MLNRSGIDFYVATPEDWETKIKATWSTLEDDPSSNVLQAAWGDIDLDGQGDVCDLDDDGDLVPDVDDCAPTDLSLSGTSY